MIRVFLALLLPSLALAQTPSGWPLHGYDLAGTRFSPLAQIDSATVSRLEPKWTWHSGVTATFQATPIVLDTVMYVSLPFSGVAALDARDGRELWRYRHEPRTDKLCCGPANRGVAVAGDKVYVGTTDGRLVALDRATGKDPVGRDGRRVRRHDGGDDASSPRAIRCRASVPRGRPAWASARRRWSTTERCSSASPAWATGSIRIRGSRSSASPGSTAGPDSWRRSTPAPVARSGTST